MMKHSFLFLLGATALAACGKSATPAASKPADTTVAPRDTTRAVATRAPVLPDTSLHGGARHYAVKSARMVMRSQTQVGEPMTLTILFDDYGAKESTTQDIVATVNGKKLKFKNITVIRDGWAAIYDPKDRIGTRSPATLGFLSNIPDFATIDETTKRALQYKELDTRTILGHECTGHGFVNEGVPVSVWLWNGIPLRSEIHLQSGAPIVSEATSLAINVKIPDSEFVVPADVRLKTVGGGTSEMK